MPYQESEYYSPRASIRQDKKIAKKKENQKYQAKLKARRDWERKRREDLSSMVGVPRDQRKDLAGKLPWARDRIYEFFKRTGRSIDFDDVHRRNIVCGRKVVDLLPGRSSLCLTFDVPGKKRSGISRDKAQVIARQLGIPYWREMQANELRAALLILIHKDGIDAFGRPEE